MAEQFVDRQSLYPNRFKITRADGTAEYVTLERADEPTVEGTPLNAATLNTLVDEVNEYHEDHTTIWNEFEQIYTAIGTVCPISLGGTGSSNGADGLANLLASGPMVLSSDQYGTTLPSAGTPGRIFFKKVSG